MAKFYADLSSAGTGHAGTEGDPFSEADLRTWIVPDPDNDELYMKGEHVEDSGDAFISWQGMDIKLVDAWIPGQPWRIRLTNGSRASWSFVASSRTWKNGIISADSTNDYAISIYTDYMEYMYIDCPNGGFSNNPNSITPHYSKCSFRAASETNDGAGSGWTMDDCIWNVGGFSSSSSTSNPYITITDTKSSMTSGEWGDNLTDGGGNEFGYDFSSIVYPSSGSATLTDFDLISGYGVGAAGGWALPQVTITQQPQNQIKYPGNDASFTVVATGTGLTYQWRKNGSNISGATSSTLTLEDITESDEASYDVVISGSVTSDTAKLYVVYEAKNGENRSPNANVGFRGLARAATVGSLRSFFRGLISFRRR